MTSLIEICKTALKAAGKNGEDVEAYATSSISRAVTIEKNDIQLATSEESGGIGIRVFKDKAVGFAATNSHDEDQVVKTAENAASIAGASIPDDANVLPEKTDLVEVAGLHDPTLVELSIGKVLEYSSAMLAAAHAVDKRVTIDAGAVSVDISKRAIVNSRGVEAEEMSSLVTYYILGMAREGDDVSTFDFEFDFARSIEKIDVERVGRELAERVIATLGATKGESFRGPVIFAPDSVSSLFCYPVTFAANAENVQKGQSAWAGKIGSSVASDHLTIIDNGTIPGAVASSSFDREGVSHRNLTLISKGKLENYFYDTRTALRDKTSSTGHAGGGTRGVPIISPTNISIAPGETSLNDIISGIDKGVLVTRFSGWPNPISGDFSGVVKGGFLISGGKKAQPLTGTLIQGNIYESLTKVTAVSKETKQLFNYHLPYIKTEDISITSA